MAQTIKLKRSSTSGNIPSTGQLDLGEIAINTYDGKVYIKKDNGTASIVEVGGASSGAYTKYAYTATSSQTTFSVSYAPGYVDVWLNGVKLDTSDYTATSGSSIVLASGATSGDLFEAIAWNVANIQENAYTKYSYTATASQTTFTASYTQGYVNVYLNGILLLDSTEYTATNGTSIVLATGATAGDSVVIEAFSTYSSGSALPSQTGNSGYFLTTDGTSTSWAEVATDRYNSDAVTTDTTLDADTHYFTGSGTSINDGVLLTIPANSLLEVKYYSAGKSL